jgi:hypothetical protein
LQPQAQEAAHVIPCRSKNAAKTRKYMNGDFIAVGKLRFCEKGLRINR